MVYTVVVDADVVAVVDVGVVAVAVGGDVVADGVVVAVVAVVFFFVFSFRVLIDQSTGMINSDEYMHGSSHR